MPSHISFKVATTLNRIIFSFPWMSSKITGYLLLDSSHTYGSHFLVLLIFIRGVSEGLGIGKSNHQHLNNCDTSAQAIPLDCLLPILIHLIGGRQCIFIRTLFWWIHISNERASRIPFQTHVIRVIKLVYPYTLFVGGMNVGNGRFFIFWLL